MKRGLVLVAYESMERARDGKPETLLAAVHNASVWPVALCSEASIAPKVWVRTEDGQPVGLTAEGKRRQTPRLIDFSFSGTGGFIMPGHAIAETYPLGSYFCLNRSGNYTILAASYLLGGKQVLVARPLTVRMRTSSTQPRKSRFEDSRTGAPATPPRTDENDLAELLRISGMQMHGHVLRAIQSPSPDNAINLIASHQCLEDSSEDGDSSVSPQRESASSAKRTWVADSGLARADYRIIVCDSARQIVPVTRRGAAVFSGKRQQSPVELNLGCAVGTWFPLDRMFDLKAARHYTVIVALLTNRSNNAPLVASPLNIHVPAQETVGLTRPLYGSTIIWRRLTEHVTGPSDELRIQSTHSNIGAVAGSLEIKLNGPGRRVERQPFLSDCTLLAQDSNGDPVSIDSPPMVEGNQGELAEYQGPTGDRLPERVFFSLWPSAWLVPGRDYTFLAAVTLGGDRGLAAVAPPVRLMIPDSEDDSVPPSEAPSECKGVPAALRVQLAGALSEEDWKQLTRFAGISFHGLICNASASKANEFEISVKNQSTRLLTLKRLKGAGGLLLCIRNSAGRNVAISKEAKNTLKQFLGFERHVLKPGESMKRTFDCRTYSARIP